jgi:hypothetical protein
VGDSCPECDSPDIDISTDLDYDVECQDCGWKGSVDDLVGY